MCVMPRWRPRLRTVLLLSNLIILVMPLAGIWLLRLYESALIRQTESELVAESAMIASAFKAERRRLVSEGSAELETPLDDRRTTRSAAEESVRAGGLDLAIDPVLPPAPDPAPARSPASPLAAAAGAALTPILREAQHVTLAAMRVTDRWGRIVATTGEDLDGGLAGRVEIDGALAGGPVSVMRQRVDPAPFLPGITRSASLRVFVAMPVVEGDQVVGTVLLSRTPRNVIDAIYGKRYPILAVTGILLAAVGLFAIVASRLITRPIARLAAAAQQVALGEAQVVPSPKGAGTREVAELEAAVARMAATLDQRARYIRGFAAHVSHEFKTPIAGAKGALELLSDHFAAMTEGERVRFLGVIAQSLDRLELLVRRLLDFARADMMRAGSTTSIPLAPLIERLVAEYRKRGLSLGTEVAGEQASIAEDALAIILTMLLDNALQHAGAGARVRIAVAGEGARTALTVADDGPGIPAGDALRVFEPFFTTGRASGGTGLGLPIARAIAMAAGGSLDLVSVAPAGAAFRLILPA